MGEDEKNDALRRPEPPPRGVRPAPLSEVARLQGRWVAPACPCGGVPSLVPVVMVQEAAHDDATVSFLLSQTLSAEQEAKEVGGRSCLQGAAASGGDQEAPDFGGSPCRGLSR